MSDQKTIHDLLPCGINEKYKALKEKLQQLDTITFELEEMGVSMSDVRLVVTDKMDLFLGFSK